MQRFCKTLAEDTPADGFITVNPFVLHVFSMA